MTDTLGARRGYHHGNLREALLDAARELVAERGAAGLTLVEAAKRVGVTGAAPYRHFADRAALMSELVRRGFTLFNTRLAQAWDEGEPDPITAFRRVGAAYLAFARAEPGLYAAMFASGATPPPEAGVALESLRTAAGAVLAQLGAPPEAAHALAPQIWALSHGAAMLALAGRINAADPAALIDAGCAALIRGTLMSPKS